MGVVDLVALQIPLDWLIRTLVLTSMLLQLLLVVCGGLRYRSSALTLQFVVWVAYICADAVAISALGTMMQYARNEMYGIWAPLLLLHLGGPDTITAYSRADNELWLRHVFTMIYQVLVAAYVIYISAFTGPLLLAAILVQIVGFTKYAERSAALAFASSSQIASTTQLVYVLMQHEEEIALEVNNQEECCIYPIMGEKRLYGKLQDEDENTNWKSFLQREDIVLIQDVQKYVEGDEAMECYLLCLSYALFKMYKRRFVGLYFHEGARAKTRRLFLNDHLSYKEVFRMVEMELKFMYDFLFSKSSLTAFSVYGAFRRFLSALFLAIAGFLIFNGIKENKFKQTQRIIMYVLLSVAFVMEIYQLCRIIVSDWALVWLICTKIQHGRLHEIRVHRYILKTVEKAMFLLRKARKLLGDQYRKNEIQQYSVIDTCFKTRTSYIWKMPEFLLPFYLKSKHIETKPVPDKLKIHIFEKLKYLCDPETDIARCRERIYAYHQCLYDRDCAADLRWVSELDLEEVILAWHVATTICEQEEKEYGGDNLDLSRILSRYCAYLLLLHPNFFPLHPDTAWMAYMKLHRQLLNGRYRNANDLKKIFRTKNSLSKGAKLARKLLKIESKEEMWELLADYWAFLLLYIAVYNKATFHAECLVGGGQFLTQLWVLLGHMGCGEQTDSPVTKKVEDWQKEEEIKKKEEEIKKRGNDWRKEAKQVTRRELKRSRLQKRTFQV